MQRGVIQQVLQDWNLDDSVAGLHYATGVSMGGPVPEQVPLDWNFRYRVRESEQQF